MRLIDADAAKRTYTTDLFDTEEDFERVNDIFDYAPIVDAEVVVRCKECKWTGGDFVCYRGVMVQHKPEDFFSYGERKEGAEC